MERAPSPASSRGAAIAPSPRKRGEGTVMWTTLAGRVVLRLSLEVDGGAGHEAEHDHHHAHDHHDAAGAVGAEKLRPVEHLGPVEHAEKLGGVGHRDGLGVAAKPAQA